MAPCPTLFLTHGGGPMPLLNEPGHQTLIKFLRGAAGALLPTKPRAIVLVTAHWEEDVPTVSTSEAPGMLYDYYGFPPEAYRVKYPAPGSPEVAGRVLQLLSDAGLKPRQDKQRGFDHGTFVPLMLMYPQADIPVVQMSILASLDPQAHLAMGCALAPLRNDGVLIVGSGSTFHNFAAFRGTSAQAATYAEPSRQFDAYVNQACTEATPGQRAKLLAAWASAPGGKLVRSSHPREEHLVPLLVVAGAAKADKGRRVNVWEHAHGCLASSFLFEGQTNEANGNHTAGPE